MSKPVIVPPGWILVPADPTPAMVAASREALQQYRDSFSEEQFAKKATVRDGRRNIWVTPFEKHLMRLRAALAAAPRHPNAKTADEAAAERRSARLDRVDRMEPEWRHLVHEYGLTVVDAVRAAGVVKPAQARHIVETALKELSPLRRPASVQGKIAAPEMRCEA